MDEKNEWIYNLRQIDYDEYTSSLPSKVNRKCIYEGKLIHN